MLAFCSNRQVIMKIYNFLYKFSLERLQKMINNVNIILLFAKYIEINGFQRIDSNNNMIKY